MRKLSVVMLLLSFLLWQNWSLNAQNPPSGTPHKATLTWKAPAPIGGSGNISGYNVYRSPAGPPAYVRLNASVIPTTQTGPCLPASGTGTCGTLVDTTVIAGQSYGYCGTTIDSNNSESACTLTVNTSVPTNPNPQMGLAVASE